MLSSETWRVAAQRLAAASSRVVTVKLIEFVILTILFPALNLASAPVPRAFAASVGTGPNPLFSAGFISEGVGSCIQTSVF